MHIRWLGHSAFVLTTDSRSLVIDPFAATVEADLSSAAGADRVWKYPAIEDVHAELLLITHEHFDHNGADVVGGSPPTIRSTAGIFDSPFGKVTAIASEHDRVAGTRNGPNTVFCFTFGDLRVCHLGDIGQSHLRPEQLEAIGSVDVLFLPIGGGPTVGRETAAEFARLLDPRLVIPMHYRTAAIDFLEPCDAFVDAASAHGMGVERFPTSSVDAGEFVLALEQPLIGLLEPPIRQ